MPITRRTRDPARPDTAPAPRIPVPHHELSLPARLRRLVTPSPKRRAWPASLAAITLIALIVFIVSWVQTTVFMALIMALAAVVAGGFLLTLLLGTGWITQPRRLPAETPRHR